MSDMTRAEAIDELCRLVSYIPIMLIDTVPKHQKDRFVRALKVGINSLKIDEQYDLMYEQAEPNCPFYKIDEDGHGLCLNHSEQKYCQDCKHNDEWDNEICLECEYDGHTRGMTRYELQEPCSDAISRQAVLDGIDTYISKAQSTGTQDDFYSFAELVVKVLPPVNPQEPKTGHWVEENINGLGRKVFCSECGCPPPFEHISSGDVYSASGYGVINKTKYCPNCGADMRGEE